MYTLKLDSIAVATIYEERFSEKNKFELILSMA
jgi:hypothetical protein